METIPGTRTSLVESLPRTHRGRDKPQLSCNLCRRRKLRCNRRMPCENCSRRGLGLSCTFQHISATAEPGLRSTIASSLDQEEASDNLETIQHKVDQLESLIVSFMGQGNVSLTATPTNHQNSPAVASSPAEERKSSTEKTAAVAESPAAATPSEPLRIMHADDERVTYSEGPHWSAILEGIADLRLQLDNSNMLMGQESLPLEDIHPNDPELLLGPCGHASKSEILAAIPSRAVVNRLILQYLHRPSIIRVLVHTPTFFKEYERFWINPTGVSMMWLGLLFAIMCIGVIAEQSLSLQYGSDSQPFIQGFREKLVQCLRLGKYTDCPPYTIETLLHYLHLEYLHTDDTQNGLWALSGLVTRLSMRMGYHRDGSNLPSISPFEAEMRRRTWAVIWNVDCSVSAQFGLPRMIHASQFDTAEPRNLVDSDFDTDTKELPAARLDADQTTVQYLVTKNRLIAVFAEISDLKVTSSSHPSCYTEVVKLDRRLHETYNAIPPGLQVQPVNPAVGCSPDVIMRWISLELSVQKSLCMLHRKYLLIAKQDDESSPTAAVRTQIQQSHMACIDAAVEMLNHQAFLFQQIQPGGCLHQHWKFSSLINQDFLFATTILCSDLDQKVNSKAPSETTTGEATEAEVAQRSRVLSVLRSAYAIWVQSSASSEEARKVAQAIIIILTKYDSLRSKNQQQSYGNPFGISSALSRGSSPPTSAGGYSVGLSLTLGSSTLATSTPSVHDNTILMPSSASNANSTTHSSMKTSLQNNNNNNNNPSEQYPYLPTYESATLNDNINYLHHHPSMNGFDTGLNNIGENTESIDELLDFSQQDWSGGFDFAI